VALFVVLTMAAEAPGVDLLSRQLLEADDLGDIPATCNVL
jgi:hypothetical protein